MPPINVNVYWDTASNGPKVDQDPIVVPTANGATVIQRNASTGIQSFQITDLDRTEFTYPASSNPGTVFTATDKNNSAGSFSYLVSATHSSGRTGQHDPMIQNGTGEIV
jgi:hypothetical protein